MEHDRRRIEPLLDPADVEAVRRNGRTFYKEGLNDQTGTKWGNKMYVENRDENSHRRNWHAVAVFHKLHEDLRPRNRSGA